MEIVKVNFFHTIVCQKYEVDIEEADNDLVRIQKSTRDTILIPLAMFKTRLTWIHQTWASWTRPAQRWLLPHHQLLAPRVRQENHTPSLHKSDLFRKVKLESGKMDHYYKIPYFSLPSELSLWPLHIIRGDVPVKLSKKSDSPATACLTV